MAVPANALFRRNWRVTVDVSDGIAALTSNGEQLATFPVVNQLQTSELDIEFKILRTFRPVPNCATVVLYNLTADHRAALYLRNRPTGPKGKTVGIGVKVEAGYHGNLWLLLAADLREVVTTREGVDWKTTLTLDDGGRAIRESRIQREFRAGTPVGDVLLAICNAVGIGIGNAADFRTTATFLGTNVTKLPGRMTVDGSAWSALHRICNSCGLNFSIQCGALLLLPKGKAQKRDAIVLSPDTGLLDSPQAAIDSSASLGFAKIAKGKPDTGGQTFTPKNTGILRAKALLRPELIPGAIVQIQSAVVSQSSPNYVITEVEYRGQSWARDWTADMVLRTYETVD